MWNRGGKGKRGRREGKGGGEGGAKGAYHIIIHVISNLIITLVFFPTPPGRERGSFHQVNLERLKTETKNSYSTQLRYFPAHTNTLDSETPNPLAVSHRTSAAPDGYPTAPKARNLRSGSLLRLPRHIRPERPLFFSHTQTHNYRAKLV